MTPRKAPRAPLRHHIREWMALRGIDQKTIAEAMDLADGTVSKLLTRRMQMTDRYLAKFAAALDVEVADLFRDPSVSEAEPDQPPAYNGTLSASIVEIGGEEFFSIGRYDMRISAGTGSIIDPHAEPLAWHPFERQWLTSVTRAMPEMLAILRVDGDSMRPTFDDGDWLLIDRTQRRLNVQGVYAIRIGDTAWVKRLSLNLRDRVVRIISDNPAYPEEQLDEDDLDVLGRVVWIVGRRV